MNRISRKEKSPFVLFAFGVLSFRFLMYFWYMKAPSQRFLSDTIRKYILGDSTRLFGLIAAYVIVCHLRKIPVRKGPLALFCLFGYSMGDSNALIASRIIRSDFLTVFGFLLTGYYGARLIDAMHSESWSPKRWASFAAFSIVAFAAVCIFQWRCSVIVFILCCAAKKAFFPSRKIYKWDHKLAKMLLRAFLLVFCASVLVHVILLASMLCHVSLLINATLLDALIEGTIVILWNIKYAEIIRDTEKID